MNIEGKSMLEFKKPKEMRAPLKIIKRNGEINNILNNNKANSKMDHLTEQTSQSSEEINKNSQKKSKEEENIELKKIEGSTVNISPIHKASESSEEEGILKNNNNINKQLPKSDVDQRKEEKKIMVRRSKGVIRKRPLNNKKISNNNNNSLKTNKNGEEMEMKRRIDELRNKLWKPHEEHKDNHELEHNEEGNMNIEIKKGKNMKFNKISVDDQYLQAHPKQHNLPQQYNPIRKEEKTIPTINPKDAQQMGYNRPKAKLKPPSVDNKQNPAHLKPKKDLKVDLVYTWVNGSDIDFLRQMDMALKAINSSLKENEYTKARFADGDELKYSLRSVEKYFDWYNKIYIVTNGQIPSWLNTSNPRIKVITHQEIFLNKKDLPTFSSVAIESNIHRIPGLLEDFIYLNDDFMFSRKITWDDFFTPNGNQKIYLCWISPRGRIDERTDSYGNSMRHVNNLFDSKFGRRIRKVICHTPSLMKKSAIKDLQNLFPDEFIKTSSHKFRANEDMQFVFSYYHYLRHTNKFPTSDVDPHNELLYRGVKEMSEKNFNITKIIGSNGTKFLCIQDDLDYNKDITKEKDYINKFYHQFFPKPSPFEIVEDSPSDVPSVLNDVETSSPSLSPA